jgi:S-adenosylmethionine uptake transporter
VITRFLGSHDDPLTIAFSALLIFTVASALLSTLILSGTLEVSSDHPSLAFLGRDWVMPGALDMTLILAIGVIAAIGFYCLSKAYCMVEASALAPFEFTYIIWAVVFGYLFWNEIPGVTTIAGILILVSSSLYISYRERRLEKRARLSQAESAELASENA